MCNDECEMVALIIIVTLLPGPHRALRLGSTPGPAPRLPIPVVQSVIVQTNLYWPAVPCAWLFPGLGDTEGQRKEGAAGPAVSVPRDAPGPAERPETDP